MACAVAPWHDRKKGGRQALPLLLQLLLPGPPRASTHLPGQVSSLNSEFTVLESPHPNTTPSRLAMQELQHHGRLSFLNSTADVSVSIVVEVYLDSCGQASFAAGRHIWQLQDTDRWGWHPAPPVDRCSRQLHCVPSFHDSTSSGDGKRQQGRKAKLHNATITQGSRFPRPDCTPGSLRSCLWKKQQWYSDSSRDGYPACCFATGFFWPIIVSNFATGSSLQLRGC